MVHYVIDGSHVAEICSYRTHTSTVIHTVRLAICRDSAAQDDNHLPLMVLSSCYLCLATLVRKVRIRLRTLTCFSFFLTTSFRGMIKTSVFDFCKFLVDVTRFVMGAMQPLAPPRLRPVCSSARVREMDEKPAEHDPHLHLIAQTVQENSVSHTAILSKLLTQTPNALLNGWSHNIVKPKSSLNPEIHVKVY